MTIVDKIKEHKKIYLCKDIEKVERANQFRNLFGDNKMFYYFRTMDKSDEKNIKYEHYISFDYDVDNIENTKFIKVDDRSYNPFVANENVYTPFIKESHFYHVRYLVFISKCELINN